VSRSSAAEKLQRVNVAVQLMRDKTSVAEVVDALATRFGVSRRQAFRYWRWAQDQQVPVPIPVAKTVFTVKLPGDVADQIRRRAQQSQQSISEVVTEALRRYLAQGGKHG
jgi:predicted DNA-binding transcriptional regulator YafY